MSLNDAGWHAWANLANVGYIHAQRRNYRFWAHWQTHTFLLGSCQQEDIEISVDYYHTSVFTHSYLCIFSLLIILKSADTPQTSPDPFYPHTVASSSPWKLPTTTCWSMGRTYPIIPWRALVLGPTCPLTSFSRLSLSALASYCVAT